MGSSTLSTVLLTAPLAFVAGWLLAKAVFRQMTVMRPNGAAKSGASVAAPVRETPAADHSEIRLLKEALAERDQVVRDLREKLTAQVSPLEDTPVNASVANTKLKKTLQTLRQGLAEKDKRLEEMQASVDLANERTGRMQQRLQSWRVRIKPLAKQFRQQKMIISELREELKIREMRQRALEDKQRGKTTAPAPASVTSAQDSEELLEVQGIGPALQKKLADLGIHKLRQLAEMSPAELMAVGKSLSISSDRMRKYDWAGQARRLLDLTAQKSSAASPAEEESAVVS